MQIIPASRQSHDLVPFGNPVVQAFGKIALTIAVLQAISQIRTVAAEKNQAISEEFKQKVDQEQQDWSASVIESTKTIAKRFGPILFCSGLCIWILTNAEDDADSDCFSDCGQMFGIESDD